MSVRSRFWDAITPPYPTPIPSYWAQRARQYWRQTWSMRLWRALLFIVGFTLIVLAATSATGFLAIVSGIVVSVLLTDDIRQTVSDIWHRRFWVFEP